MAIIFVHNEISVHTILRDPGFGNPVYNEGQMMSRLNGFLRGVRIVDLSRHYPGPLATMLLADLGADVLKIEPPGGDELRDMGPKDSEGRSLCFEAINAGKRTRRMDLRNADARKEFMGLVDQADVLVESFRPGVMARLGIGYPALRERNPRLIYCSLNGFGYGGSASAGHDINYLALAGILAENQSAYPASFVPPVADATSALFGVISIIGAIHARQQDGKGCEIDLALADAVMPLLVFQLAELRMATQDTPSLNAILAGRLACYRTYKTADGRYVALGALEPKFWQAFCYAANRPDWIPQQHEQQAQATLIAEVEALFAGMSLAAAVDRFQPADCCFSPVVELTETLASDHHRRRGVVQRAASGAVQALFPAIVDGQASAPRPALREVEANPSPWPLDPAAAAPGQKH